MSARPSFGLAGEGGRLQQVSVAAVVGDVVVGSGVEALGRRLGSGHGRSLRIEAEWSRMRQATVASR